jgi:hypothetical protein
MATWYDESELKELLKAPSLKKLYTETYRLLSHLALPIGLNEGKYAYFNFYSRRADGYQADHLTLCSRCSRY